MSSCGGVYFFVPLTAKIHGEDVKIVPDVPPNLSSGFVSHLGVFRHVLPVASGCSGAGVCHTCSQTVYIYGGDAEPGVPGLVVETNLSTCSKVYDTCPALRRIDVTSGVIQIHGHRYVNPLYTHVHCLVVISHCLDDEACIKHRKCLKKQCKKLDRTDIQHIKTDLEQIGIKLPPHIEDLLRGLEVCFYVDP